MKKFLSTVILLGTMAVSFGGLSAQQRSDTPLTNTAVIKLVRAGFKEKTVIAIIHSRANNFDLGPDRLIDLKKNGVSESIILAMLSQDGGQPNNGDGWDDDAFFERGSGATRRNDPKSGDDDSNSTGIFGSGGGSSSETRNRGARGSGQEETTTTGSASVRIIRPPSEAGGAQLKLEKIPTLNNESIIQLIDAGFSEGTIIKRIEDSPAEFDISPAKLQELRKRRVSEPIIAAMRVAMEDSSPAANNPSQEN